MASGPLNKMTTSQSSLNPPWIVMECRCIPRDIGIPSLSSPWCHRQWFGSRSTTNGNRSWNDMAFSLIPLRNMNRKSPIPGTMHLQPNRSNPSFTPHRSSESVDIPSASEGMKPLKRSGSRRKMKTSLSHQNLARFNDAMHRNSSYGNLSQISQRSFHSIGSGTPEGRAARDKISELNIPNRHFITRGTVWWMNMWLYVVSFGVVCP